MKFLKLAGLIALLAAMFAVGYTVRATKPSAPPQQQKQAPRRILYYVDPMHPSYTADKPGIAPDCGMPLEPVYAEEPASQASDAVRTGLPEGAFRISPERQQLIGVTFATVDWGAETQSIRAVGKVAFDETRVSHVHTRVDGWIEKVFVDFTGDVVKQGDPMLTIYSPEMLASEQELLLAGRARDLMRGNPLASAAQHGESLFQAAKRRLELWDLSDAQIQQVLSTGEPIHSVTLNAPASGVVTDRKAFANQKVTADTDLYTITDLSHVWIVADVFEADIAAIRTGDRAYVTFPNGAAPPLAVRVNYIQPQVDPITRTLKVRFDAANPGLRMKPDMFVNVEFGVAVARQLTVPAGAILDTGDRRTVFVDRGEGYLEPRQVVTGARLGDRVAIVSGLSQGDRVVASGTFLIDSESQLRAAATAKAPVAAARSNTPPSSDGRTAPRSQPSDHGHD
jgi:RND family efflux transporter MFP subunit